LEDKATEDDWKVEWRAKNSFKDEHLVFEFSCAEEVENLHHHKNVKVVGIVNTWMIFFFLVALNLKAFSQKTIFTFRDFTIELLLTGLVFVM